MSSVSVKPELIASACSRTAHALDWGTESLVAFGTGSAVALYDPTDAQGPGIHATLQGHTKRVNSVRFVRTISGAPTDTIVSASADCTARVWQRALDSWECKSVLSGHQNPVISTASIELEDGRIIVVTASTDGTMRVFEINGDSVCVQTVDVGSRNAIDVAITVLPDCGALVLATGNTDNCVHLYTRAQAAGEKFAKALKLTGHDDWVTAVTFLRYTDMDTGRGNSTIAHWQAGDVVLASASEDKYVRLWRISQAAVSQVAGAGQDSDKLAAQAMLDAFAKTGDASAAAQLSTRAHIMAVASHSGERSYAVSLDSVLIGHDNWVHSVTWTQLEGLPSLISASADSSVIVWAPDADAGVWSSVARLGEAGGAVQGFLGAAVSPSGTRVLAHGYQGSLHMWRAADGLWLPQASASGHYASVQDVCWDPRGNYLLSVSTDQTARLYAPVARGWREIARPQIHGYDMRCAAFVSPFIYVSGSDEMVLRVFTATQQFVASWQALTHSDVPVSELSRLAVGASLPVLGLSNKAVDEEQIRALQEADTNELNDNYQMRQTHTDVLANAAMSAANSGELPLEEHLLRHTLWPEVDKLYGHPYEIFAVAAAHSGDWIATACKASLDKHAAIRVYSAHTWQPPSVRDPNGGEQGVAAVPLMAHSLTITRMRFSPPDDKYLLSVSRDRSWAIFEKTAHADVFDEPTGPYRLAHHQMKAHTRIIWDAAWAPDARFFATASRDKAIKLWPTPQAGSPYTAKPVVLTFPEAVTAVDFLPALVRGHQYVLAAALENGQVFVLTAEMEEGKAIPSAWNTVEVSRKDAHVAMVHRLAWRPQSQQPRKSQSGLGDDSEVWMVASASDDQSVRIFSIAL
ncbi:Elongator subunit elp2 [Coemansia spiralis]|uniref:Elongator complex protein 2 n=1 Tax=Coemansia spiralis TaxID=417178 RepID=A0A9W8GBD0_9FUNG|nr:Elongator subunit elp2 [Coemansia spiralis]